MRTTRLQAALALLLLGLVCLLPSAAGALSAPAGTPIVNRAEVVWCDANGNHIGTADGDVTSAVAGGALLRISKLESTDPVSMGGTLTYTIRYENLGNVSSASVTVTDQLSDYVVFQSASGTGVYDSGAHTVTWTLDSVEALFSGSLTATVLVKTSGDYSPGDPDTIAAGTVIPNTADLQSVDGTGQASISTTVGEGVSMQSAVTYDTAAVSPGGTVTYTVSFENNGNETATGVTVRVPIPSGTVYVDGSATGAVLSGGYLVWTIGQMDPGESGQLSFQLDVSTLLDAGDSIEVTANVGSNEEGFVLSDPPATVVITTEPFVSLTKTSSPASVVAGSDITYTLLVTNAGTGSLTGIVLEDTLPEDTVLVESDPAGTVNGDTVTWNIGTLVQGQQESITLTVRPDLWTERTRVTNRATVTTDQTEAVSVEEDTIIETAAPGMEVQKLDGPDPVFAGNPIYYTIVLTNTGNIPLTGIQVTDHLPAKTIFRSANEGGQLTGSDVVWNVARLEVDEVKNLLIEVTVDSDQAAPGDVIQNSATVTSTESPLPLGGASTTVAERTDGVITFHDANWDETYKYRVGDTVYIQVEDHDQNADSDLAESIEIDIVNDKTGDAETITLTETGVDTGIFRTSLPGGSGTAIPGDGVITMELDSKLTCTYEDPLDAAPVTQDSALIDPYGVVFDSVSGALIENAVVTMYWRRAPGDDVPADQHPNWPPAQINPYTTGPDGKYEFPLVPVNDIFYLGVQPPSEDYEFPTSLSNAQLPAGFVIDTGSRGETFSLAPTDPPLNLDLPLDPPPGRLQVIKQAGKREVTRGDYLTYTITISHGGGSAVVAPVVGISLKDFMPPGIQYIEDSTTIDGVAAADPVMTGSRNLTWPVRDLDSGDDPVIITYAAVVGSSTPGGKVRNTAYAEGESVGEAIRSNTAWFSIIVSEGVFTSRGTIVGRIFVDADGNRLHNFDDRPRSDSIQPGQSRSAATQHDGDVSGHGGAGKTMTGTVNYGSGIPEPGLEGIVIFMEDGTRVVTDRYGKFSIPLVQPGTHVLRVDESTLPPGYDLVPLNNRFMGDGASQFVDMPPGALHKANFAVRKNHKKRRRSTYNHGAESVGDFAGDSTDEVESKYDDRTDPAIEMQQTVIDAATTENHTVLEVVDAASANGSVISTDPKADTVESNKSIEHAGSLEEQIKTMSPDLAILSPADGAVVGRHENVLVKTRFGTTVRLSVNGREIGAGRIGRTVAFEGGGVTVLEYISVSLEAGSSSTLTARLIDPWGNPRESVETTVTVIGEPDHIEVIPDRPDTPADGASEIVFTARLLDVNGHRITDPHVMTVDTSAGEITSDDADYVTPGHQVPCRGGECRFAVRAPSKSAEARVIVLCSGIEHTSDVFFSPHLRDLLVVGMGEVVYGNGRKTSGDLNDIADGRWFEDGSYQGGRGALFVKGDVGDGVLMTASYDSKKPKADELFRQSDTRTDHEEKYPLYGDESRVGYETMSRGKFYAKLEKDRSSVMFGDYRTDITATTLGAYRRSFNGYKTEVETGTFGLTAFATHTDQTQVVDTIQGRGVSGLYYLDSTPVVEGSERVLIETRHRRQIERVLKRDLMVRFADYTIEYDTGAILFKAPVPARDSELNPVYIVVTYESKGGGQKHYIYGGRLTLPLVPRFTLGMTSLTEEQDVGDFRLNGLDITVDLLNNTVFKAEWARTETIFQVAGMPALMGGNGWSYELDSSPRDDLTISGYYRRTGQWFGNQSAVDARRGATRLGVDASWKLSDVTVVTADFMEETDDLNDTSYRRTALRIRREYASSSLQLELSKERANDRYVPKNVSGTRDPLDITEESPTDLTAVGVQYRTDLRPDLGLILSHRQDVEHSRHNLSYAELDWSLDELTTMYLRQAYAKFEGRSEDRTVLGVESKVARNTTAFSEYRLLNGANGRSNQQSIGLRNRFSLGEKVTGNLTLENLNTLSGEGRQVEPDAFSVTAAVDYLPRERVKLSSRLEFRDSASDRSKLAELGLSYALDTDYTLLLKERFYTNLHDSGGEQSRVSTILGLAYRPVEHDRFNGLLKLENRRERNNTVDPNSVGDTFIHSLEGIYQASRRLQVMGKYAGKRNRDSEFATYIDLVAGRVLYDITEKIDFGVELRMQTNHTTGTDLTGGTAELGFRIKKNLWFSAGYSFDEFDPDLTGAGYQGEGPYVKIRFKFNERMFR